MAIVRLTREAREQLAELPRTVKARVEKRLKRLENWPHVSGVKALSGDLAGYHRDRTGDYRIQFVVRSGRAAEGEQPEQPMIVVVEKIGHRDGFYGDD